LFAQQFPGWLGDNENLTQLYSLC